MGSIKAFGETFGATVKRASKMVYENTVSKLAAITVQGAIDELANTQLHVKVKKYTLHSGNTLDSGVSKGYNAFLDISEDVPTGVNIQSVTLTHGGYLGNESAGVTGTLVGNKIDITSPIANVDCYVTVTWVYSKL